jgi:DNA polymerase elongation subunit (family B)
MKKTWNIVIPAAYHIDLQDLFRLEHNQTSMASMAVALIDEEYADMKSKFRNDDLHKKWEKTPLDRINIEYAARDAYVSYEAYHKIRIINYGQRHLVPQATWGHSEESEYSD